MIVLVLWPSARRLLGFIAHKAAARPGPEERILLGPLGYRPPGPLYMLSGRAFSSLDFIDAHHLLFTFHQPRLMRREQNPGRYDDDQMIEAVILALPGGTSRRLRNGGCMTAQDICGPLGGGKFLVRQRNTYLLTDASLKLHPYIEVATPVTGNGSVSGWPHPGGRAPI